MLHDEMRVPFKNVGMDDEEWARFVTEVIEEHGESAKRRHAPRCVGTAQRKGWLTPMKVHVAWCEDCQLHVVSCLSGYGRLTCANCQAQFRAMTWPRFRDKILRETVLGFWIPLLLFVAAAVLVAYGIHSFI